MRGAENSAAVTASFAASGQRTARVIVLGLESVDRDHSPRRARVSKCQAVRTPFDQHQGKKHHRQNDVPVFLP